MVFDVVYDPWPTPLAAFARSSGRVLVAGLDLLVHQAVLQVELMTGAAAWTCSSRCARRAGGLAARPLMLLHTGASTRRPRQPLGSPAVTWDLAPALVSGVAGRRGL